MSGTELARLLFARIREEGPIPLATYMELALAHPELGYYRRKDPIGRAGDFVTAPEISQMFGELIGMWCASLWERMGSPAEIALVELGPGKGTLMTDLLRAAALRPDFRRALRIHLVETGPVLRAAQAASLAGAGAAWHDGIETLPAAPALIVANEFFDALPIRQFVRRAEGWRERMVDAGGAGFVFADGPLAEIEAPAARPGDIFESAEAAALIAGRLGARLAAQGGAALIFDYGHARTALGDTLQAVRGHMRADALAEPGEADLTAHVDFQALAEAARPARAWGPMAQGAFLRALGIELRAAKLMEANPGKAREVEAGLRRLIDAAEMGNLFQALALTHPDLPAPPGFTDPR